MANLDFTPNKALQTLRENVVILEELGDRIDQCYVELIVADARLKDAEIDALTEYFTGDEKVAVSAMNQWMKFRTAKERRNLDQLDLEMKRLKSRYTTAEKIISAVQTANKINVTEANNTNL